MVYAERGNRVKQISEADIQKYVEQGYKITNAQGAVIQDTVPLDVPTLRLAYRQHISEIRTLKAKVEELTKKLNAMESKVEPAEESVSKKALVIEDEVSKPTSKKKSKVAAEQ